MNQLMAHCKKLLTGSGGLALVALTVLLTVGLMPQWVSAHDGEPSTFTSPLDGPHHGDHGGIDEELRETLDAIIDRDALLADVLGITVEELAAAKESGVSLHELIDEAGLDKETVHEEIQSAVEAAVQQAVEDGLLTQEQADVVLNPPARPENDGQHEQGPRREHGRPEGEEPNGDDANDDTGDGDTGDDTTTPATDSSVEDTTTDGTTTTETAASDPAAAPDTHRPQRGPEGQHNDAENNDAENNDDTTSDAAASDTDTSDTTAPDAADPSQNNHHDNQHDQAEGNRRPRH